MNSSGLVMSIFASLFSNCFLRSKHSLLVWVHCWYRDWLLNLVVSLVNGLLYRASPSCHGLFPGGLGGAISWGANLSSHHSHSFLDLFMATSHSESYMAVGPCFFVHLYGGFRRKKILNLINLLHYDLTFGSMQ